MRGLCSVCTVSFCLITVCLVVFINGCKGTNEIEVKEYTVQYSVRAKTNSISRIRYLGENKDTVVVSSPPSEFLYTWNRMGKTDERTMLELTVKATNLRDTIIYKATANTTVLYIDTLLLPSNSDIIARRSSILP